jgi:transposase
VRAVNAQFNLPAIGNDLKHASTRVDIPDRFEDQAARRSVEADLELIETYGPLVRSLELYIDRAAKDIYAKERVILESIPGIGPIISLTILLETDQIDRFPTRQKFSSYCRLVYPRGESDGKLYGAQGRKHGNPYLKWAFSEAAVCVARVCEPIGKLLLRLERKYGKGKGKTILGHKLGRCVYYMLLREKVFDLEKFLRR